jgi:hypothetical protein
MSTMIPFTDQEIRRHLIAAIAEVRDIYGDNMGLDLAHPRIINRINRRIDALKLALHASLDREERRQQETRP